MYVIDHLINYLYILLFSTRHRRSVPNKSNVLVFVTYNYAVVMWATFTKPYYIIMQVSLYQTFVWVSVHAQGFFGSEIVDVSGVFAWDRVVRSVAFDRAETQAHDSVELEEDKLLKLAEVTSSRPPLINLSIYILKIYPVNFTVKEKH